MAKDYLTEFSDNNKVARFQQGGPAPAGPEAAPAGGAEGGSGDPVTDALMQVLQSQDPAMALEFCNMLAEQMGMGGNAGAPMPAAGGGMEMYRNGGSTPMFSKGGALKV